MTTAQVAANAAAVRNLAARLVDVELWKPCPGGWDVNGWADKQESTDETKARSERAKAAAAKRWSQEKAAEGGPQMRLA